MVRARGTARFARHRRGAYVDVRESVRRAALALVGGLARATERGARTGSARRAGGGLSLQTFAAFQLRDFRLLWLNNFSYALVQGILRFAFPWLLIETLLARDFFLGAVSFALGVPVLFLALPVGVLSDRWDRRMLMFVSQFLVLAASVLTAVLIWIGVMTVPWAMVMALFAGVGIAVGQPVRQALIPAVVPSERLMNAITLNSLGQNVSQIAGPALGGAVIALWGIGGSFGLQAILVGVGVLFIIPLRIPQRAATAPAAASLAGPSPLRAMLSDIFEGFRFITFGNAQIRVLFILLLASALVIMGPWQTLLPRIGQEQLEQGAFWTSMLFAFMGVGTIVSSLILASIPRIANAGGWFSLTLVIGGSLAVGIGLSDSYPLTVLFMVLSGFNAGFFMNLNLTLIQSHTPGDVMGRVMAIYTLMLQGGSPFGGLLAGLGAEWTSAGAWFALCGGAVAAVALVFLITQPGLRRMPSHPEPPAAAPADAGSG
ncbi:MAG: MFS transporter [Dehalococcoidia bacterium]|nr:MFS transporter [Dehalococcoidia bacterium]MYD29098.1 MFS transporter [Dehalococcoidia bacterium]